MSAPAFELDLLDPRVRADPYPWYRRMREVGTITRNGLLHGVHMVVGHAAAVSILRNPAAFSSARRGAAGPSMLNADPPEHTRLRNVLARAFTPQAIAALEPRVHDVAEELLRGLTPGRPFDVVAELAKPLPVTLIADLLGVPREDRDWFWRRSGDLVAASNETSTAAERARGVESAERLRAYFRDEAARRRTRPSDDLIGLLVRAGDDGVLSEAELLAACVLLLVAGNETTTNLVANAALTFCRQPELWERLRAEPALLPEAVEEALRFDGPVQGTNRLAVRDVEIDGVSLPAGSPLFVLLGAANRDPGVFEDPDRFQLGRRPNPHVAFGSGGHVCLGQSLARLEARVALAHLARRAPALGLARPDEPVEYQSSFLFHGPRELVIVT